MTSKNKSRAKSQETTLRHLWLAGLGAISIARREAANAANDAAHRMEAFKQQAEQLASQAQNSVVEGLAVVRQQGEAKAGRFSADVEIRLAPVLAKLGLAPPSAARPRASKPTQKTGAKRPRKAAAGKTAGKRAVRNRRA
jgi:hypothetical protein